MMMLVLWARWLGETGGARAVRSLPSPEPDLKEEDTGGAVDLTRAPRPRFPPDSAGSRAAPTASAVPLSASAVSDLHRTPGTALSLIHI